MFKFFGNIIDIIVSLLTFFIRSIVTSVEIIFQAIDGITFLTFILSYLPAFILPILLALIAVAILKFILNFGGN